MTKGESEMSWYAEVILSHIIIEKQSDMERRHGSPHIITSLFFHNCSVKSLSLSPMRSFGKKVMAEKKSQPALLPEKCLWMVGCKQKSFDYTV